MENIKENRKVLDLLTQHEAILLEMHRAGIGTIPTALDYLSIYRIHQSYSHIKSRTERKELTAMHCKISKRKVEMALSLMSMSADPLAQ